ncbi:PREDICTED: E3 ubiquitin-protein ligase TRIM69-like isoform X1 [Branchiostoma belcheri]|uniref:E3 ubiquitin-protein ligase TRIM69-like isoform X1 n=2 Tax=Branchiostoma belcheri TaxID=7741 RepID=A0A6P4ZQW3_BRABE|nr:PREDICTED: E3 ubiquitin-protein ligase TRIM69-like isoform X1 [Branchiostoma belcheri]
MDPESDSGMASWNPHPSGHNTHDMEQKLRQSEEAREDVERKLEEETRLKVFYQDKALQLESKLQDHEERLCSLENKMAALMEKHPIQQQQQQQVVGERVGRESQDQSVAEDSEETGIREVKVGEALTFGLDPATIHGKLDTQVDSEKGKILISYNGDQEVVNTVGRFVGKSHTALADVMISGGRWYWEVDVRKSNHYRMGVASKTVKRDKWIGDTKKSWCIRNNDGEVSARHNYDDSGLRLVRNPPIIGVLLDYDSAKVHFFDVDSGKHLQTYEVDVSEPLRPAFQVNEGCVVVNSAAGSPAKMEELLSAMDAAGDTIPDFTREASWHRNRFFNDKRMADISMLIGKQWRQVATCLGLQKVQLDKMELNHPKDHTRQVMEGLVTWRGTAKDDDEMLTELTSCLKKWDRSDLAEQIQEEHDQLTTEASEDPS